LAINLDKLATDRDKFATDMDKLAINLDKLATDRDKFATDMDRLARDRDKFDRDMDKLKVSQEKTDEQIKKTEKEIERMSKETDRKIAMVSREIGGGLGRAAEGLTAPNVPKVFKKWGIKVLEVQTRVKALDSQGETKQEIDLLCPARLNGQEIILAGEVKAHLTAEDVKYFVDEQLAELKSNFPRYKELDIIGFVSGLNVDENAAKFAYRKGLYILVPKGKTMKILNPPEFKAMLW